MEKIISRLVLLLSLAFVLFIPRIGFAASVDLTVNAHTVNGDGVFNFSVPGSGTGLPPVDFSITTQGGAGQYQVVLPNPNNQFSILQSLPDGWRQTGAACTDTASGTQFSYLNNPWNNGTIGITLGSGEHHIVCDVTDQYSADWLAILNTTVKVIVNTINNDDTFNFIEINETGYNVPLIEFSIATQNNSGDHLITLRNPSNKFSLGQIMPAGWHQTGFVCVATKTGTGFVYSGHDVTVTEDNGNDNIVCTITNEYREEWLQDNFNGYLTINTHTINGDGTFDYTVVNSVGPTFPPGNFTVATANGSGTSQYVWAGDSDRFSLTQFHPDGWQPVSLFCQDTNPGAQFEYDVVYHSTVGITINRGYNRITCTFTNQRIAPPKTPVLIVPGILGTEMYLGQEILWPDWIRMLQNPSNLFMDPLALNNDLTQSNPISPGNVIKSVSIFDYSEKIIDQLTAPEVGYEIDKTLFKFPYDWRYGVSGRLPNNETNSSLLAQKIEQIRQQTGADKIDVIAHSLGGLIVKKYVMENTVPHIGKAIFVGVPNLGSPIAVKALLMGHNFDIPVLSGAEIKKLSQNMPAAFDLAPSMKYRDNVTSYIKLVSDSTVNNLSFSESQDFLVQQGANAVAQNQANAVHNTLNLDDYDVRERGVDAYKIVGCKSGMLMQVKADKKNDGSISYEPFSYISSDDTVPFASADSISTDDNKAFYAIKPKHGSMMGEDGIKQTIANILSGTSLAQGNGIIKRQQLTNQCDLNGIAVKIYSPVDVSVTDGPGNKLGLDQNNDPQNNIPGASFDVVNGHKFVYLPTGDGETYNISLQGTDNGTYTLIEEKIAAGHPSGAQIFKDQPVTPSFSGNLDITGTIPEIVTGDGTIINPTYQVEGNALEDTTAPMTSATIDGLMGQAGFYRSDVIINLSATDSAQSGVTAAGLAAINYTIDNATTTSAVVPSVSLTVSDEGNHTITYFAQDKVGNQETPKTISFNIDKTAPKTGLAPESSSYDAPFAFNWNIVDESGIGGAFGVDVSTCAITVDNTVVSTGCAGNQALVAGVHAVIVSASDMAGNGASVSRTYTVNRVDTGTLTIIKKSGTANGTFKFSLAGPTALSPSITTASGMGTSGSLALRVGQYTLSEIAIPGWSQTGLSCSVSCSGSCVSSMSQRNFVQRFTMQKNMKIICSFTNRKN